MQEDIIAIEKIFVAQDVNLPKCVKKKKYRTIEVNVKKNIKRWTSKNFNWKK